MTMRIIIKVALCTFLLVGAAPRMARAEPQGELVVTNHAIQVDHIVMLSKKSFDAVKAALEKEIPRLDTSYAALLKSGDSAGAKTKLENGPPLSIFLTRDHGNLLRIAGPPRKAIQYEIGNPFTASKMTRHDIAAANYAPLRVLLYENAEGHAVFEYDRPSSLFGQFGNEDVTKVARDLDQELENALRHAAE
jgi:uncharacterized protein (DUF302 family)